MMPSGTGSCVLSGANGAAPQGVELRHLRYFVAVADAGTFTHAAERMYIAQPTLSQQIRRLEEMVGTPLLRRRREGVRLTEAGMVLLEESRIVLSLIDHGVSRTRQAAGIGRPRLRFVVPPHLPETLTVGIASRLRSTAADADVDMAWIERVHVLEHRLGPLRLSHAVLAARFDEQRVAQHGRVGGAGADRHPQGRGGDRVFARAHLV